MHPTVPELKEALTPQYLLTLAMIHIAMVMGVILFGAVTLFLLFRSDPSADPRGEETVRLLSMIHLGVACSAFMGAPIVFKALIHQAAGSAQSAAKVLVGIQAAYLVRLALLEGPALFGLVICFLMNRALLNEQPVYGLNLLSAVLFILFVAVTFPTRDRLESLLQDQRSELR